MAAGIILQPIRVGTLALPNGSPRLVRLAPGTGRDWSIGTAAGGFRVCQKNQRADTLSAAGSRLYTLGSGPL